MTDTPDRPGEHGRHEDEPTLTHGPFPGAASSPGARPRRRAAAEAPRADPQADDPRRDPDTVSIPRPPSGYGPPPGSAGSDGRPVPLAPDAWPSAAGGSGGPGIGGGGLGRVWWFFRGGRCIGVRSGGVSGGRPGR